MTRRALIRSLRLLVLVCLLSAVCRTGSAQSDVAVQSDVMVAMRDGVRLATDVYLPANDGQPLAGPWPTILTRTPYSKEVRQDRRRVLRRARLRLRGPGHARAIQLRRRLAHAHRRRARRLRRVRVDRKATLVQRPGGHDRHVLRRRHAACPGHGAAAATRDGDPGRRDVEPRLRQHAQRRRLRAAILELDLFQYRTQGSRQSRDPATAAVLRQMAKDRRDYLVNLPLRRGTTPLKLASEYEDWLVEAMGHGTNDDFWKQNNIIDYADQYKDIPIYLVGGWYDSWGSNTTANYRALSKTISGPVYLIMGPWVHGAQGGSSHGQVSLGDEAAIADPLRLATPVVRPLAQGRRQRRRPPRSLRHAGADLRDGLGRRSKDRHRPAPPRRLLAQRARVAARPHAIYAVLPASRRQPVARQARWLERFDELPVRSGPAGAHHRRQHFLGHGHSARRRLRPARRRAHMELRRSRSRFRPATTWWFFKPNRWPKTWR